MSRPEVLISRCFSNVEEMLLKAESLLSTMKWSRFPEAEHWADSDYQGTSWNVVQGQKGSDIFLVIFPEESKNETDGESSVTLYCNLDNLTILLLPKDLAGAAFVYEAEVYSEVSNADPEPMNAVETSASLEQVVHEISKSGDLHSASRNWENSETASCPKKISSAVDINLLPVACPQRVPRTYKATPVSSMRQHTQIERHPRPKHANVFSTPSKDPAKWEGQSCHFISCKNVLLEGVAYTCGKQMLIQTYSGQT